MKILFVRHGESVDDLENRYGGWADYPLTENGIKQIEATAAKINTLETQFEIILTSPLRRAQESAQLIASTLNVPIEIFPYVKERNTYGLLSGMEKEWAKRKYPDQVEFLNKDEYVDGSERYEDLVKRVKKSIHLLASHRHQAAIVVTHGNYLKCFTQEILDRSLIKKEDGGLLLVETAGNTFNILLEDGITTK